MTLANDKTILHPAWAFSPVSVVDNIFLLFFLQALSIQFWELVSTQVDSFLEGIKFLVEISWLWKIFSTGKFIVVQNSWTSHRNIITFIDNEVK